MKKILILLMPLFFILPIVNVFANNTTSILEGKNLNYGIDENSISGTTSLATDNDMNTFFELGRSGTNTSVLWYEFDEEIEIKGYLTMIGNSVPGNSKINFYDKDGNVIYDQRPLERDEVTYVDLNNVKKVSVNAVNRYVPGVKMYEFKVFNLGEMPVIEEIRNLTVETKPDRVNLSWDLPETEYFHHVNIYRKDLGKNEQETTLFEFLKPMTVHASTDNYNPIFETNGTYFNDLTVEENSSYEYKLTTKYENLESVGLIVKADTGVSPAPPLEGGGGEQQANGDYLFKWSSPREGQVRIFVDGTEYATVEASTGQLLVPGSDMKYSALGKPLISYQTIGLNGEESNITSPDISDLEIPVTPGEVIETGGQLIGIVSSFILLGLSFIFAPKLIKFIRQSFRNKKEDSGRGREREQREQRESRTSIRETRQPRQGRTRTRTPREGRA